MTALVLIWVFVGIAWGCVLAESVVLVQLLLRRHGRPRCTAHAARLWCVRRRGHRGRHEATWKWFSWQAGRQG